MTKCPKCSHEMEKINEERILLEPEFLDMSDEEMIEYFSEEITGNYEKWGVTRITYRCFHCEEDHFFRRK